MWFTHGLKLLCLKKTAWLISLKWLEKKRTLEDSDALAYGLGQAWNCFTGSLISLWSSFLLLESSTRSGNLLPKYTWNSTPSGWQVYLIWCWACACSCYKSVLFWALLIAVHKRNGFTSSCLWFTSPHLLGSEPISSWLVIKSPSRSCRLLGSEILFLFTYKIDLFWAAHTKK